MRNLSPNKSHSLTDVIPDSEIQSKSEGHDKKGRTGPLVITADYFLANHFGAQLAHLVNGTLQKKVECFCPCDCDCPSDCNDPGECCPA